jgi:DNA polymerase-3 subunit beta
MKFSVSRDALHGALSHVGAAARSGSDAMSLAVKGNTLTLVGSSGDFTVTVDVEVKGGDDGTAIVPASFFQRVVSHIPSQEIAIKSANAALAVSGGPAAFSVRTIAGMPVVAVQTPDAEAVSVSGDLISSMSQVAVATADKAGSSPVLTGVLLTASEDVVEVAATDSYRVAVRALEASALPAVAKSLIPGTVIEPLVRLMANRKNLTVRLGESSASFQADGAVLTTRLISGAFPQYQKVIPAVEGTVVRANRDALMDVLRRATVVNNNRVSVTFSSEGVSVTASSAEHDGYTEALAAEVTGDEVTFSVNPKYLTEGLGAAPGADVEIACSSGTKPVLIQAKGSSAFRYVVMPVRV